MGKVHSPQEKFVSTEIGEVLRRIRKEKKISMEKLAERLGVSSKTVQNWELNRNKPDLDTVTHICDVLDVSKAELLGIPTSYDSTVSDEAALVSSFRKLSQNGRRMLLRIAETMAFEEEAVRNEELMNEFGLFLVHPGKAAAGPGEEVFDQEPSYCFLRKNDVNEEADGIICVKGHSMEPDYPDGRSLYYKKAETAKPGDDVLVNTGNGYVVKRLDDKHQLYSVNPDLPYNVAYEDMYMKIEGIILGLVPSTDRPKKEERDLLESLLEDEIREFCHRNSIME